MTPPSYFANLRQDHQGDVIEMIVSRNDRGEVTMLAELNTTVDRPTYDQAIATATEIAARDRDDQETGTTRQNVRLQLPAQDVAPSSAPSAGGEQDPAQPAAKAAATQPQAKRPARKARSKAGRARAASTGT